MGVEKVEVEEMIGGFVGDKGERFSSGVMGEHGG